MASKYTKGPLVVKVSDEWPFSIKTFSKSGELVFFRDMPCHSSKDQSADDAIQCRNFRSSEREAYAAINRRAIADEILRAAAPELLEALNQQLGFLNVLAGTVPLTERDTHRRISIQQEELRAVIAKATGEL